MLLVDETSIRKRHRYVTVTGERRHRRGARHGSPPRQPGSTVSAFLAAQGHRWCRAVKVVVSDGSAAYKAAIDAQLGHARHVLDRFHVIRWFQAGLVAVRRDVQRRPEGSKPAFDRDVFRARFLLMRRPDKLDAADQARLDALFAAHPRLKAAWDALGELHGLYLADDHKGAMAALDRFADIYATGLIPEFSDTVDAFLAWHAQILDWHRTGRPSNGRIDRTNNLLQVLRRRAHGFTNYANFEARGLLLTWTPPNPAARIPKKDEGSKTPPVKSVRPRATSLPQTRTHRASLNEGRGKTPHFEAVRWDSEAMS